MATPVSFSDRCVPGPLPCSGHHLGLGDRQPHSEHGPLTRARAVCRHRSAVLLDQVADDGEAEPQATVASRVRLRRLLEPIEDQVAPSRGEALPTVRYDQLRLAVLPPQRDADASAGRRELDRVVDQVAHHLLEP